MTGSPKVIAAAVGGLFFLVPLSLARGQVSPHAVTHVAAVASGSIVGLVQDEQDAPIPGAVVSALGAGTLGMKAVSAVTDRGGRFEIGTLTPGPYLIRAHVAGYVGSRGQVVEVLESAQTLAAIAMRRPQSADALSVPASSQSVLIAGVGGQVELEAPPAVTQVPATTPSVPTSASTVLSDSATDDDHSETAWRLRHLRRSILRDATIPFAIQEDAPETTARRSGGSGSTVPSEGFVANLFAGVPFTGQFNLLTTGTFDSPKELFGPDNFSRSIAYASLAAPLSDQGDWSMQGALTQGDISSWFVAGAYATRVPARHRYDLGLSYSTQRYQGGNPAALRGVSDGSRNVGALYGFDTFTLTPAVAVSYGARFSRYDYLAVSGLLSSRVELALSPSDQFRLSARASSHATAPGAEEFLPPVDIGLWLPPQRTFSSIIEGRPIQPQRTNRLAVQAEHDLGRITASVRVFREQVTDQSVTMFGIETLGAPRAQLGHYFVGSMGDVDATGWGAGLRTTLVSRVHGSVEYTQTSARWNPVHDGTYLVLVGPSVAQPNLDRVHDLSTAIETNVPETSTRVLVVYRLTNAGPSFDADRGFSDSRFDVQVHQSLPFMDFSVARWEMLLAIRNTFHEGTIDSSVFDELLVVRPPKRVVGGLTLRF